MGRRLLREATGLALLAGGLSGLALAAWVLGGIWALVGLLGLAVAAAGLALTSPQVPGGR